MNKDNSKIVKTLLYTGFEGAVSLEVVIDHSNETMWTTQKTMAQTFNVNVPAISKHLKNIFEEGELNENSTVSKMEIVQKEGKREVKRQNTFYNLDAIISVGYRVNSKEATQFRIWATNILKEYIIKGYVLDKELLKNGTRFGKDYFDKLLEEIKEIRTSERRFYQKVTDLFATSYDYNPKAKVSQEFFKKVQNKLHYAVSKQTAPEIISKRASCDEVNMGLRTWSDAPKGKILLNDVLIAKNYLKKDEIDELNRIVSMYLDYAENLAIRHKPMLMEDWASRLDKFLDFNEYDVLNNKGNVSRKKADEVAKEEYENFRTTQDKDYISDFDRFLEENVEFIN
ncbi:MAG: virulence RhuM family protein [Methanobrevibacter sp.]|nr:virulence RhuM family protein [Methanobrevibacter sp.]